MGSPVPCLQQIYWLFHPALAVSVDAVGDVDILNGKMVPELVLHITLDDNHVGKTGLCQVTRHKVHPYIGWTLETGAVVEIQCLPRQFDVL